MSEFGCDLILEKINFSRITRDRPLIALIINVENWVFSNIAQQIVKNLSSKYDFRVIPSEIIENINQVLIMTEDCDLMHFFGEIQ